MKIWKGEDEMVTINIWNYYADPLDEVEFRADALREAHVLALRCIEELGARFKECYFRGQEIRKSLALHTPGAVQYWAVAFSFTVIVADHVGAGELCRVWATDPGGVWDVRVSRQTPTFRTLEELSIDGEKLPQVICSLVGRLDRQSTVLTKREAA